MLDLTFQGLSSAVFLFYAYYLLTRRQPVGCTTVAALAGIMGLQQAAKAVLPFLPF